ncbi:MAG: hypothetical protein ACMG6S_31260 [Byssovorax sp.]
MSDEKKTRYEEIQWLYSMKEAFAKVNTDREKVLPNVVMSALNKMGWPPRKDAKEGTESYSIERVNSTGFCASVNGEYQHTGSLVLNLNGKGVTVPIYITSPVAIDSNEPTTFTAGKREAVKVADTESYCAIVDSLFAATKTAIYDH